MTRTVLLGAIFDIEAPAAEFEDSRVVLRGARHDFRQGNPAAASINQQAKDSSTLSFGARRARNLLYRITICLILSHLSCGPAGASRPQRSLPALPFLSSYAVAPTPAPVITGFSFCSPVS